nr:ribonuclease H-like domain-containing protein [Tanacetum cinerariifolium]
MEHSNTTPTKIPILETRKFEQWKFRIQRTTLLLALLDEHQLRFSKYKTAQELWATILKKFGGNEATRKTKKNLLKQQYGNFKAEGKETLEQTFNRLQIDEDDIEEMDIKWNMALLSMSAGRLWKKTGKKIYIQGTDVAGFDKSKRSDKNKEGLGYSVVPPPPAQVYSPSKKDISWTGLPEFADDIITDYTRPSHSVESNLDNLQNNSYSTSEKGESTGSILSKPKIKFVKPADNSTVVKTDKKGNC